MEQIKVLHKIPFDRKLNVCAYARVSTSKDEQETSLEEQINFYTSLILENPNWNFAGIYADDGISGTTKEKRTSFNIMLSKALQGQIDIILVKSISRFARNVIDLLTTIQELREKEIEVFFERENFSSLDYKCDMMLTCYAKFAEEESLSISQNCNWRIQKKYENGNYTLPVSLLLGYAYDNNKNIIIIEEKAKWVRKMYEMYLNDYSITDICKYLDENNVKTIAGKENWNPNSIRRILRNEKYAGDCLLQKTFVENPITHNSIINYGQKPKYLIQNGHPAIIDRDTWNKVQQKLTLNAKKYNIKSLGDPDYNRVYHANPFTKLVYCPYCNHYYLYKKNYHGYKEPTEMMICSSNKNTKICEQGESLFIQTLKGIILKLLNLLNNNRSSFKKALISAFQKDEESNSKEKLKALESEVLSLKKHYEDISSSHSEFQDAIKEELIQEITELTNQKNLLQNKILTMETATDKANEIISQLKKIPQNLESLENINFTTILKKVIVLNRNKLVFIVGSEDISMLPPKLTTIFETTFEYKIRKTRFTCQAGIYINK